MITDEFVRCVLRNLCTMGPEHFTKAHYAQMHAYVLGEIARAAYTSNLGVAIELAHKLAKPVQGRKRRQLQARPDLTLYVPESREIWGLVEYESIDINASRLGLKRHFLANWPPNLSTLKLVLVVMTVPDAPIWGDTPSRESLEEHRSELVIETADLSASYSFVLIDHKLGIDEMRFEEGEVTGTRHLAWV